MGSTLVTALTAGNLVTALEGNGPFTVFAPSNAAFAKVPTTELARLLDPKNVRDLATILKYHVVSGAAVYSKGLKPAQTVKTLEGRGLLVTTSSAGVLINSNAKVTVADNAATNGVVHIIDTVLIPPKTISNSLPNPSTNGAVCKSWCSSNPQDWAVKCTWDKFCAGCSQCPRNCKTWCEGHSKDWQ